jgi:hypothetical protein
MFRVVLVSLAVCAALADNSDPAAVLGPYTTSLKVYSLNSDIQNPQEDKVSVWYPSGVSAGSNVTFDESNFKFISYAHGMFGGGSLDIPAYNDLLHSMASFGYIIGGTHQCSVGCFDDCNSLKHDPPCFGNYYKKQLGVIDWAKDCAAGIGDCAEPFERVDWSAGVGIAGHSMGGQATLFSSSDGNPEKYDIRAAVMHHAFSHSFPAPTIPFLDFTGEEDTVAPADTMGIPLYESANGSGLHRGLVDKTMAGHHEPDITCMDRNGIKLLAQFSAAWFKLYLDKTPEDFGLDFQSMIYGSGSDGVCSGGDGEMTQCTIE